jgi:hypothetical protein
MLGGVGLTFVLGRNGVATHVPTTLRGVAAGLDLTLTVPTYPAPLGLLASNVHT